MIEQDTIKLLRECDAGIKMGVSSIDDVLDNVYCREFEEKLTKCKDEHEKLEKEIEGELSKYHDDGKAPNPMAKGMSWIKTNMMLTFTMLWRTKTETHFALCLMKMVKSHTKNQKLKSVKNPLQN